MKNKDSVQTVYIILSSTALSDALNSFLTLFNKNSRVYVNPNVS